MNFYFLIFVNLIENNILEILKYYVLFELEAIHQEVSGYLSEPEK